MPAPTKFVNVISLLTKEEATYGTAVALTASTDGQQLQYSARDNAAPMTLDYASDGDLGPSVSALGKLLRTSPTGLSIKGDWPMRLRPAGAAYSASVVPSMHKIFKASGLTGTVITTPGSESWTYAPSAVGAAYTSLCAELYPRGEKWAVAGILGSLKYDATDTKPPIWTFSAQGIASLPVDASIPATTYPLQTVPPALGISIALTLGGLTTNAEVVQHSFDMARTVTPRVNQTASGGHRGFVPDDRAPIMKVTLEATALTTSPYTSSTLFDPYRLMDSGQVIAASLKHGTVQYFRDTLNFPQCQVIAVTPTNNNSIATVELTLQAFNSTGASNDDFNIVLD